MRKINLDVDTLKVESFETAERGAEKRGTVRGYFTRGEENVTCRRTECGAGCPSGPVPCEGSHAFTDGMAACLCANTTGLCID